MIYRKDHKIMAILDIDGLRSVLGGIEGLTPETIQAILDLDVDYEDKTSELEQQIEALTDERDANATKVSELSAQIVRMFGDISTPIVKEKVIAPLDDVAEAAIEANEVDLDDLEF